MGRPRKVKLRPRQTAEGTPFETRAERNIRWCEENLYLPDGKHVGQKLKVAPFMRADFVAIYDNAHGPTRRAIISRPRKNAKDLALDTPIPTPDGWRTMGEIEPGDRIYGSNGQPVLVTNVSEVFTKNECYAVGFSDGSSIVAGAGHIWTTRHAYRPWTGKPRCNGDWRTGDVTTEQIFKSLHRPRTDGVVEHNHKIDCALAIEGTPVDLPIPPYTLGYWLGNGTTATASCTAHEDDVEEVAQNFRGESVGDVLVRKEHKNSTKKCRRISILGKSYGDFRRRLRAAEVIDNKHIPNIYFGSGLAQRWTLLQGLMDSDGTVNRCGGQTTARCSYSSSVYRLAYDVWRLARSLGLKAVISEGEAKIYDKSYGPCWKVEFAASLIEPVFRLRRKQELLPRYLGKRSRTLSITSCDRVETVPTKCLMVDAPDHLFLVGHGCIPTHNTVECAMVMLLHLCGPEHRVNSQLYSCAQSRDQAAVIYDYAMKMVRISPTLRDFIRIKDAAKELHCPELGTMYKALSAESSTAFGKNPSLILHDELGQVRGPRYPLYEAMETATGAQEDPLTIIISTQAPTDADLLSILIDDAKAGHDKRVVLRFDSAPITLDPFAEDTIALANPAFRIFMNAKEVLAMADEARRMPARENEYRNLILNQRIEAASLFIKPRDWQRCNAEPEDIEGRECYAGLDLSEASDLTAFVIISRIDGVWNVKPTFWLPAEGLYDKARANRIPYDLWVDQGYLKTTPGNAIQYEHVAKEVVAAFRNHDLKKVAFDRWHFKQFKPWLIHHGLSEQFIEAHFVEFGQGTQSMSPALRELEVIILNKRLAHGDHPVLNMCAANAVVEGETTRNQPGKDASNRKLSKKRSTGRIDGMVALTMAFGVAPLVAPAVDISTLIG